MNNVKSNLFALPAQEQQPGICYVCDLPATMRAIDKSIGQKVGKCCMGVLAQVDIMLGMHGFAHPAGEGTR